MTNLKPSKKKTSYLTLTPLLVFLSATTYQFSAFASDIAGKTILAKGIVEAIDQTSKETRKLKRRSKIFEVDSITTGEKSKAQFSMSDGGLITLKANTELRISSYKFDENSGENSATLEVVNGGLRSISGLIKKSGGDYQIKTPVGSIGIRGTHFAVDVVGEDVFFAVYSGNIDVQLENQQTLSLGASEDFSFASVNTQGDITPMTQAPAEISLGFSDSEIKSSSSEQGESSEDNTATTSSPQISSTTTQESENIENSDVYNESEFQGMNSTPIAELLATRTGSLTYQSVVQSSINSSAGEVSNLNLSMTVDFDNASVPEGVLSFTDSQGEWFAAYSGLINIDQIDLNINFASHGNNKAEGEIFGAFSNGLDEITGGFNLHEINNPSVNADGSFKVQP